MGNGGFVMSYRAGFVGLIGLPNAGKSSLVNLLVGEKVGIVARKPQTTRQRVLGIHSDDEAQIIFIDTPGLIKAESGLNRFLQDEAERVIEDSDALLAVLNIDEAKFSDLEAVMAKVAAAGKPWAVAITKMDLPQDHRALIIEQGCSSYQVPVFKGSVLKEAVPFKEALLKALGQMLPETSGPLYDTEQYTTQTLRELSGEIIREKCFATLHEELPYGLAVIVKRFDEDQGPAVKIYADIIVSRDSHRGILIGAGGTRLRDIGQAARLEMERILGRKVYLELYVAVKKNWSMDQSWLKELGYVVADRA